MARGLFQSLSGVSPEQFQRMAVMLRPHWKQRIVEIKNRDGPPYGVGCLYRVDKAAICLSLKRIEVLGVSRQIRVTAEEAQALILG